MEKTDHLKKCSFRKSERLCSKRIIDQLFAGKNRSFAAYPLRAVFTAVSEGAGKEPVVVLISVSKKHFKRAVRRNRVKRQIRESYRRNKQILLQVLEQEGMPEQVAVAFLWLSDELASSQVIEGKMRNLLYRIAEYYQKEANTYETVVDSAE